ncbi:MAG: hypothetical protein RI884_2593 [Pseudomonadota bacterium]|jgi:1-acyl-sn-glycerol-3-phosphate acyltransferase
MKELTHRAGRWISMTRVIALTPAVIVCLAVCDLALRIALASGSDARFQSTMARCSRWLVIFLRVCWGLRLKLDPRLARALDQPGGTIIVANHQSPLDICILAYLCGTRPTHFVCRPGLDRGIPAISLLVRRWCTILRHHPQENKVLLQALGDRIATTGGVALIFPEGHKSERTYPHILRFNPGGLACLAQTARRAQVMAIAIRGASAAWSSPRKLPAAGVTVEVVMAGCRSADDVDPKRIASECERDIRRALLTPAGTQDMEEASWTWSPTR